MEGTACAETGGARTPIGASGNLLKHCRYGLMVNCFDSPFGSYFVPESQLVVDMVMRYLAVINSSSNFIIYCMAGKQFRRVLATLLHLRSRPSEHNVAAVRIISPETDSIFQCVCTTFTHSFSCVCNPHLHTSPPTF